MTEQYFGKEYEIDAFGKCEVGPELQSKLLDIYTLWKTLNYDERKIFDKRSCMRLIAREYVGNPHRPKQPLARDLHSLLKERMGIEKKDQSLAFYSSIDTPLDRQHTDGFFMLDDDPNLSVTMDVTLDENEEHLNYTPAPDHVVLFGDLLQKEDESDKEYINRLKPYIDTLHNILDTKIALKEKRRLHEARSL